MKDLDRPFANKDEEQSLNQSEETKPVLIDNISDTQAQLSLELPNGIKLSLSSKHYEVDTLSDLSLSLIEELIQRLTKKNGGSYTG